MKQKIAIIIERANIALGGAERSTFELAAALQALNFEVDILAAKGRTNAKNIHILCESACAKRTCHFTFTKALKKHLAKNHYDIITASYLLILPMFTSPVVAHMPNLSCVTPPAIKTRFSNLIKKLRLLRTSAEPYFCGQRESYAIIRMGRQ